MELKELLDKDIETIMSDETETNNKFIINTPNLADWAIEKIKSGRARFDMFEQVAKNKIELLKQQIQEEKQKSESRNSYLLFKLNEYLDTSEVTPKKTKTKLSLEFPSGKVERTLAKLDFVPIDGDKLNTSAILLEYCDKSAADYIEIKKTVSWGELKKDLEISKHEMVNEETGEVIEDYVVFRKSTKEILDCIGIDEKQISIDVK